MPPPSAGSDGAFGSSDAATTALAFASFLAFGAVLVLFGANASALIAALDLDYAQFALFGSALSLGLGSGILAAGPASDRFPRKPLFVGACLAVALATATLGPGSDFATLLRHTVVIGFGAGFYETVLNALIVERLGERAPRRLLFVHAAATASASTTPLVFDALRRAMPLAWYDTFRVAAAIHLLLILAALFVRMPRPRTPSEHQGIGPTRGDDRVAFAAVCTTCFAYVGVETAIGLFVGDLTQSVLGLPESRAARTLSAFWGGLLFGRLAIGLSPRPIGAGTIAILAALAAASIAAFGLGWVTTPEGAMATTGFLLGGVFPMMIGLAGLTLPSRSGTAVGIAGGLGSFGAILIPWRTGRLAEQTDLPTALASLALWLGLLASAAALVHYRRRPGRGTARAG